MSEEIRTEEVAETTEETKVEETKAEKAEKPEEPSIQDLMVEVAKLKRNLNKASAEAADWKKKFRATQSVQEIADAEKAEAEAKRQEENEAIRRELSILKLEKSYLGMGFTTDEASRMAVAETDNEIEAKMKIMAEVDARKQKEFQAEFIKSRPEINAGSGSESEDLFIKGFNSVKPNF